MWAAKRSNWQSIGGDDLATDLAAAFRSNATDLSGDLSPMDRIEMAATEKSGMFQPIGTVQRDMIRPRLDCRLPRTAIQDVYLQLAGVGAKFVAGDNDGRIPVFILRIVADTDDDIPLADIH